MVCTVTGRHFEATPKPRTHFKAAATVHQVHEGVATTHIRAYAHTYTVWQAPLEPRQNYKITLPAWKKTVRHRIFNTATLIDQVRIEFASCVFPSSTKHIYIYMY